MRRLLAVLLLGVAVTTPVSVRAQVDPIEPGEISQALRSEGWTEDAVGWVLDNTTVTLDASIAETPSCAVKVS